MKNNPWHFPQATGLWLATCLSIAAGCNSPSTPENSSSAADSLATQAEAPANHATAIASQDQGAPAQSQEETASKAAFDPIQENGKFFEGWAKPKLALVISGRQEGYLEPCGCAGLENQKGGFSRRHALFKELQQKGWPLAAVDVGGLVRRFGRQAEVQFGTSAEALKTMGYSAVGFGSDDLRLSAGEIIAAVAGAQPTDGIFVSANVNLFDLIPKVRLVEAGGMKLGITSVLGKSFQEQVNNAEVEIRPAAEALKKAMPQLKDCDVRILLAYASMEETAELARRFPTFDLVVTSGGFEIPPYEPKKIEGTKARLIEVGHKGMYVVVAGFYDNPKQPIRFQRVALDSRFKDTPEMKQVMASYQEQLQQMGWDGLGLRRVPAPQAKKGNKLSGQFSGAASCKECHSDAWDVWSTSKHAHATETLTKIDPPRQYDPECISCHATGWNAGEFFPYTSGFDSLEKTPLLTGNGCENCHGPGAAHVTAEKRGNEAQRVPLRELLHLTWEQAKADTCIKCHDHDNSPEFGKNTEKYWSEIEH
jgi:hypothetical protein